LLTIPKTLAINAAKDSTDLVAKLRAYHNAAQSAPAGDPKKALMFYGLDLINGQVRDNLQAGVLEPTISKIKSLKSALEAATSLLRIDDSITVSESNLERPRGRGDADKTPRQHRKGENSRTTVTATKRLIEGCRSSTTRTTVVVSLYTSNHCRLLRAFLTMPHSLWSLYGED
jgi:hypothetical protein